MWLFNRLYQFYLLSQKRDLRFDDIPNDVNIQPKIFVRNYIAKTGNLTPGNFGMLIFETLRHLSCCFTQHFKTSDDR